MRAQDRLKAKNQKTDEIRVGEREREKGKEQGLANDGGEKREEKSKRPRKWPTDFSTHV